MTDLCLIGEKYLVDKCPKLNHSYTPVYHELLKEYRNTSETVLEIGIGNYPLMSSLVGPKYVPGASLRMWRDYFTKANVYGCDIDPSTFFTDDRIQTYFADQSNEQSLEALFHNVKQHSKKETIDFIIDDGSHIVSHMKTTFKTLWKYVSPGGIYIIEDIQLKDLNLFKSLYLELGFTDAECIHIHKGKNNWDAFVAFKKK
jgi:hypothetical protein